MRAFLGIPCPEKQGEKISNVFSSLLDEVSLKPVRVKNYHITVKFIGEVEKKLCEDLGDLLEKRLNTNKISRIDLRYVGVFPNPGNPRVIWAGAGPEGQLKELNRTVEEAAFELGVDREDRKFHPHLTLGRIKNKLDNPEPVINWLKEHGNQKFGQIEAPELILYKSNLTPEGPEYRELKTWQI